MANVSYKILKASIAENHSTNPIKFNDSRESKQLQCLKAKLVCAEKKA